MRFHFSSSVPCALKLGGALAGFCGEAEKFTDADAENPVLAEFIPTDGNFLPLYFALGESFLNAPPFGCELYRYGFGADVRAARFFPRDQTPKALAQKRCGDILATVVRSGEAQLALENGKRFELFSLPQAEEYALEEATVGNERFISVSCRIGGRTALKLYNGELQCAFDDTVNEYSCGETLRVRFDFGDIAGHTSERTYRADSGALVSEKTVLRPREGFDPSALNEKLLPFAFFQEIAAGGDASAYLAPSLENKKDLLKDYLGNFCGVYLPKEIFYLVHGEINAAGLVYRQAENLFDVKFFLAETKGGKIYNIRPIE